jgi:hypothetical protein
VVSGGAPSDPRPAPSTGPAGDAGTASASYVGVGCLTAPAGFFGGGMLGVAIGMIVGNLRGCVPPEGLPICSMERYLWPGALLGLLLLPTASLLLLRRSRQRKNST